jgi:hypothetical protein
VCLKLMPSKIFNKKKMNNSIWRSIWSLDSSWMHKSRCRIRWTSRMMLAWIIDNRIYMYFENIKRINLENKLINKINEVYLYSVLIEFSQ